MFYLKFFKFKRSAMTFIIMKLNQMSAKFLKISQWTPFMQHSVSFLPYEEYHYVNCHCHWFCGAGSETWGILKYFQAFLGYHCWGHRFVIDPLGNILNLLFVWFIIYQLIPLILVIILFYTILSHSFVIEKQSCSCLLSYIVFCV